MDEEDGNSRDGLNARVMNEGDEGTRDEVERDDNGLEDSEDDDDDGEYFDPELFDRIFKRLSEGPVGVRVLDVKIKGNVKTKDSVIEVVLKDVKKARTVQELLQAAAKGNAQLESMGIFDKCVITLDAGPKELPGTANVVVDLEEAKRTYSGDIGFYSKPEELELRYAVPLGFYKVALNFGLSGGIVIPWGPGFRTQVTSISDRFFMGGHSSLVCDLRGPTTLLGFRSRGVGPTEVRRAKAASVSSGEDSTEHSQGRDILGGDLAVTGFADLSFDLPLRFFRQSGIHGHCFVCAGNLIGLTGKEYKSFSFQSFLSSVRYSAGAGIVIPLRLFRFEVNFCHIIRQFDGDRGKQGIQLNLSPY